MKQKKVMKMQCWIINFSLFVSLMLFTSCIDSSSKIKEDISSFEVIDVMMYKHLNKVDISVANDGIIDKLSNVSSINGPVKGLVYEVKLANQLDTIEVFSFSNSPYILFDGKYYISLYGSLIPDSTLRKINK